MAVLEDLLGSLLGCLPCCVLLAIPTFFVCVFVLIVFLASKQKNKYGETLKSLALELGGEYKKGSLLINPVLSGEYKGRRLFIDTFSRTREDVDGHHETTYYMRVQLWHKGSVKGEVSVYREGFLSGLGKMLGAQDIQIGNPEFDKEFMVRGEDELQVKKLLDVDLQKKLLESKTPLKVMPDRVYFESGVHIADKEKILKILDLMSYVADKVENL